MDWQTVQVSLRRCGRDVWPAGWSRGREWFQSRLVDYDLWFIWQGHGFFRVDGRKVIPLRRGVCLLMRPGGRHEAWQAEGSRLGVSFFHFEMTCRETGLRPKRLPGFSLETSRSEFFEALASRITLLQQEAAFLERTAQRKIHALQNQLLSTLLQEYDFEIYHERLDTMAGIDRHRRQIVSEAIRRINQDYRSLKNMDLLARQMGYSKDHFQRIFKHVTGTTPYRLLINVKMDRAKHLLRHSDMNIGRLANELGYENVFHFSRQFKEVVGCAPSVFRGGVDGKRNG